MSASSARRSINFGGGDLVANTALAPTQCGTASPGGGADFLHDYMDTFPSPPIAPTGLTASPASGTQVNLSWNASTEFAGAIADYDVYRDGALIATTSSTSYPDTGVTYGTSYTYSVRRGQHLDGAGSDPAVAFISGGVGDGHLAPWQHVEGVEQCPPVLFQREHELAAMLVDAVRCGLHRVQRVRGKDLAVQVDPVKHHSGHRHLVRLLADLSLRGDY